MVCSCHIHAAGMCLAGKRLEMGDILAAVSYDAFPQLLRLE